MKHLKNLQSKASSTIAAAQSKIAAAQSKAAAATVTGSDASPSTRPDNAPTQTDLDGLMHRVLEASHSANAEVEHLLRADGISDMDLQELGGRLFVLLFQSSDVGTSFAEVGVADNEDQVGSRIRSGRALIALVALLPVLPLELAGFYLSSLHALLAQSEPNTEFACSAGVFSPLLRWLPRLLPGGDCTSPPAGSTSTKLERGAAP